MAESGDSDDISDDLSVSVSFSPFESEESEQEEMEEVHETIEPFPIRASGERFIVDGR